MFLLGSISQPHSSFSNTLALIGPHPHQLSLTASSTMSSEEIQMYLVWHRPVVGIWLVYLNCICGQLSRALTWSWSGDRSSFFLPCWCLSVSLSTVVWRSGNNVVHQFALGQGYDTPGPKTAWQRSLSLSLARALNISFPRAPGLVKFSLISQQPIFYFKWACRCIRIADTFNLSSIARWHLMSL